jgi:hypothetical protein
MADRTSAPLLDPVAKREIHQSAQRVVPLHVRAGGWDVTWYGGSVAQVAVGDRAVASFELPGWNRRAIMGTAMRGDLVRAAQRWAREYGPAYARALADEGIEVR